MAEEACMECEYTDQDSLKNGHWFVCFHPVILKQNPPAGKALVSYPNQPEWCPLLILPKSERAKRLLK